MPLNSNEQNTEPLATYIICIHHNLEYEFIHLNFKTKFQKLLTAHLEIQVPYTILILHLQTRKLTQAHNGQIQPHT
jgi:hypothetical protein